MKKAHSLLALSTLSIAASASALTTAFPHAYYDDEGLLAWGLGATAVASFARCRFNLSDQKVDHR